MYSRCILKQLGCGHLYARFCPGETNYKGSLVSVDASGYAAPLAAGETFVGIAFEGCDNSAGSDGDKSVRVYTLGDFEHALSGATVTDIGAPVFASGDDTLTLTAAGNSFVGRCVDVPASGTIILRLQPLAETSPAYTVTNGTTDRAYDADTVGIAELADIVATLIADLQGRKVIG